MDTRIIGRHGEEGKKREEEEAEVQSASSDLLTCSENGLASYLVGAACSCSVVQGDKKRARCIIVFTLFFPLLSFSLPRTCGKFPEVLLLSLFSGISDYCD